jgi:hypothetical protein
VNFSVRLFSGRGRPLFLTPRRFIRICHWIEQGQSATGACKRELVTYQGFRRHVKRNEKYQRRLREAEETREHLLREFHMANILRHAPDNLSASFWWLEHRWSSEFGRGPFIRPNPGQDQEPEEPLPSEVLARHRTLLLQQAREDEGRQAANEPKELAG